MYVLTTFTAVRYEGSYGFSVVAVSESDIPLFDLVPANATRVSDNRYELPTSSEEDNDTFIVYEISETVMVGR